MSSTQTAETGKDLVIDVPSRIAAKDYTSPEFYDDIMGRIRKIVEDFDATIETEDGRSQIRSLAHKIARSKSAIDGLGKGLTEDWRKRIDEVNAVRNRFTAALDDLKKNVRAPLTEWEEEQKKREADFKARIQRIHDMAEATNSDQPSEQIAARLKELQDMVIDESWDEFREAAETARDSALYRIEGVLAKAREREAEKAELERLRNEQAAKAAELEELRRKEAERQAADEKAQAEAEAAAAAEPEAEVEPAPAAPALQGQGDETSQSQEGRTAAYLVQHFGMDTQTAESFVEQAIAGRIPNIRFIGEAK